MSLKSLFGESKKSMYACMYVSSRQTQKNICSYAIALGTVTNIAI